MVLPGEEQKNRRHIFTISGLPANTMVTAEIGTTVADRAIASEDVPVVLVVEHGHPVPGWTNRGTMLDIEEGTMVQIVAEQMVPPRILGEFPYQHGAVSAVDDIPPASEEGPVELTEGDMMDQAASERMVQDEQEFSADPNAEQPDTESPDGS